MYIRNAPLGVPIVGWDDWLIGRDDIRCTYFPGEDMSPLACNYRETLKLKWFNCYSQSKMLCITGYQRKGRAGARLTGGLFGCDYRGSFHGSTFFGAKVYGLCCDLLVARLCERKNVILRVVVWGMVVLMSRVIALDIILLR